MPYFLGANCFWVLEGTLVSEHLDHNLFVDSSQPGCVSPLTRESHVLIMNLFVPPSKPVGYNMIQIASHEKYVY